MFRKRTLRTFAKIVSSKEAIRLITPGSTVLTGGFGICGNPNSLIKEISEQEIGDLTFVIDNTGAHNSGIGSLLGKGLIKKMVSSFVADNKEFETQYFKGEVELELIPQGTLAEKIRSGGKGIPAFWTPTGANTLVENGGFISKYKLGSDQEPESITEPKEAREINGKRYVMEKTITGDFALVKAWKADKKGNLQYRLSSRNFNQDMATAGKIVIAEVEEIVETGELDPEHVHTPSVFVDYIVQSKEVNKPIEKIIFDNGEGLSITGEKAEIRIRIASRVAKELKNDEYVNLGIGIPTLVPNFLPEGVVVNIHAENGVLGVAGYPKEGEEDPDLINAGKECIKVHPGASFFSSSDSFGIIRGGHLAHTILGGMEVSSKGDIANWIIPGKLLRGMGGAMDLVASGSKVIVAMQHTANGKHKILDECTLPLTGKGCISMIITDMAVFDFSQDGELTLKEVAEEYTLDQVKKATGCQFKIASDLKSF